MTERAEPEQSPPAPGAPHPDAGSAGPGASGARAGRPTEGEELASAELAALYIQQGEYERGIDMYRALLAREPNRAELRERLEDAEALADLLILRPGRSERRAGFREGSKQALAQSGGASREERIARLNAWLERVRGRA